MLFATACLVGESEPRLDISSLIHVYFSPWSLLVPLRSWLPSPT